MIFAKYIETVEIYFEEKNKEFYVMCLVSDTANLLEKVKYFRNENTLMLSELGDIFFRVFGTLKAFGYDLTKTPIDLESMKSKGHELDKMFAISEHDLVQGFILELGIISNIMSSNLRFDIVEFTDDDNLRMKASLYSYALYALIMCCKYNFSVDRVLDFNISKHKKDNKEFKFKTVES